MLFQFRPLLPEFTAGRMEYVFLRYYRTDEWYVYKSVARVQRFNADCENCTAFRIRTLDDHIAFLLIHCRYSVLRKIALMVDPFFGKIYRTVSTYRTHAFRHITATVVLTGIVLHLYSHLLFHIHKLPSGAADGYRYDRSRE